MKTIDKISGNVSTSFLMSKQDLALKNVGLSYEFESGSPCAELKEKKVIWKGTDHQNRIEVTDTDKWHITLWRC